MRNGTFDWEKPLIELENRISELQRFTKERDIDFSAEIEALEKKAERLREEIYSSLSAWQRVLLARHPKRPTTLDYISRIFDDFVELHGDRVYRDDPAIVAGIATLDGQPVTVVGPQKGRDTKENIQRNFGLPHPEGYRKAMRVMQQAAKFGRPIVTLVDVVGAYPGIGAEERGQGLVIAECIRTMSYLPTKIVCVITGEGGSGGALAIGVGNKVLMLEHAWYSVISPEMCANILWKDSSRAPEAAALLKLTAQDLSNFGVIDEVIQEPLGGAHRNPDEAAENVKQGILNALAELDGMSPDELVHTRLEKFRKIGKLVENVELASLGME